MKDSSLIWYDRRLIGEAGWDSNKGACTVLLLSGPAPTRLNISFVKRSFFGLLVLIVTDFS